MKRKKPAPKCEHEPFPLPSPRSSIEAAMVVTAFLCRKCGRTVRVPPAAPKERA